MGEIYASVFPKAELAISELPCAFASYRAKISLICMKMNL